MKDWLIRFLTTNAKTHNSVLLITAASFARVCWYKPDPMVIGAVGGTLAALYTANGWAGTRQPTPPPAAA